MSKSYVQGDSNTQASTQIEKTLDLYLDSDNATSVIDGKYHFLIQPAISNYYGSKAKCYVKDMSFMNSLMNIRGTSQDRKLGIQITDTNTGNILPIGITEHVFDGSRYQRGDEWADKLNSLFGLYVSFNWNEYTQKMKYQCVGNYIATFVFQNYETQKINLNMLKFMNTTPSATGESASVVDLNDNLHGIYMLCDQVKPDIIHAGDNVPGKMVRVPINTGIGSYVHYNQRLPIHRSTFESDITNKLTIKLVDDAGIPFEPNRWTATITVELYKAPVKNELHRIHSTSRAPPLVRP
tara:strand:+ start:1237 stop:2121 length:885 start_codon:yes stop_codon:yes gene_type:complete